VPGTYNDIGQAIQLYENSVQDAITALNRMYALSVGWASGTVALVTVGAVFSNLAPLVGAVGLGGAVPIVRGKTVINTLIRYYKDKTYLRTSVTILQTELLMCRRNNPADLAKVKQLLRAYLLNLQNSKIRAN